MTRELMNKAKSRILATATATCVLALGLGGLAAAANATDITGGNDVIARATSDSYSNFSILDGNKPISGTGDLTSWSIYAIANASPVELLIYRAIGSGYTLVGESALETPASAGGVQTFALAGGLPVQAGDLLGLYFEGAGSVEFDSGGGPMLYTNNDSGMQNATNFVGSSSRTYSVSVSGAAVPEPATWAMMLAGLGMVGFGMRRRAAVSVAYA